MHILTYQDRCMSYSLPFRKRRERKDLNLVNIDLAVLLPYLLICTLHGVNSRHRVAQVISDKGCGLHVEYLLRKLC